jgi:pimeloyl-ACP methyl ester carboxylesterase
MVKTSLVLCPGLLNDDALWRRQTESLADVADPLVADFTHAESIGDMAASVLGQAPARFALVGLSMGGYVAFEILRRAPERVARVALFDTTAAPDTAESRQKRLDRIDIARKGGFARLPAQMLPDQLYPDHLADERITGTVIAMAERVGAQAFIRQQTAIMNRIDSRPSLAAIAVPTLVACGRQDKLTPPDVMAQIAAAIPGAKYVLIDEAGHFPPLEQPQATIALLRYWLQA